MAVIDAIDKILKEELSPGIRESLPDLDPVYKKIRSTSMGVERDGLGRDWKFIQTFETGLSGAYAIRAAGGSTVNALTQTSTFDAPQGFPTYSEATATNFLQRTITLKEGYGNIAVPHQYLRADQLTASIGSAVRALFRGTAKKVAHTHAVHFYMTDATNFAIGDVGTVATTASNNGTTAVTIDFDTTDTASSGMINRFFPGMLVDIYDSSATTQRNSSFLVVVDIVDYLAGTVIFKSVNGSSTITFSDNDIVVFKDSLQQGFSGLESWIKNSGSVFGITLASFPQFKSHIPSAINNILTEQTLNQHYALMAERYGVTLLPDANITTAGVTVSMVNDLDSDVTRFNRQGQSLSLAAGFSDVGYEYNGKPTDWLISNYCERKTLYGVQLGNDNIKRYVPPAIPGTASEGLFDGSVEFVAPLGGFKGVMMQSRLSTGAAGDGLEAPFVCVQEVCPRNVQSLKLSGLTETIG